MLGAAYEAAADDDKPFEVVYVASDRCAGDMQKYMDAKHPDWLRVPYDAPEREELKKRFGRFAGAEAINFPGVARKSGIPAMVILKADGTAGEEYDCDSGMPGSQLLKRLGPAAVDGWVAHAWP